MQEAKSFGQFGERWLTSAPMADSTRAMRRSIFDRDLAPVWTRRLMTEIAPDDLRHLCKTIVDCGAPATALHVRDIVKQIYAYPTNNRNRAKLAKYGSFVRFWDAARVYWAAAKGGAKRRFAQIGGKWIRQC